MTNIQIKILTSTMYQQNVNYHLYNNDSNDQKELFKSEFSNANQLQLLSSLRAIPPPNSTEPPNN